MSLLSARKLGLGVRTQDVQSTTPGQMWAALSAEWDELCLWLQLEATEFAEREFGFRHFHFVVVDF